MERELALRVFSCIDNTTLSPTDTEASVDAFCRRTREMIVEGRTVAAVCVYPRFVCVAKRALEGSGIRVASVAGAFPHGQLPLELKVAEVAEAARQGADEVDIVINRGLLLDGKADEVRREVEAMRAACMGRTLKVIVETCDLASPTLIAQATELAIGGGADFVKTSTGKGTGGATIEAAETMLGAIKASTQAGGRLVGFKAAGGIREPEQALEYARVAKECLGDGYVDKDTFRIGASGLTDALYKALTR